MAGATVHVIDSFVVGIAARETATLMTGTMSGDALLCILCSTSVPLSMKNCIVVALSLTTAM